MLEVDNLFKDYILGYEVVHALAGVSLDVACGELVAIMGPSGSGKGTLLHLIGGLDQPHPDGWSSRGRTSPP